MRLYAPLDPAAVQQLASGQACRIELAFTVSPDVVALAPNGDSEEHEHIATQLAAAACPGRIVVGVFATTTETGTVSGAPGAVKPSAEVPARDLVCLLVGDEGDQAGDDADVELSWYDNSEVALVRDMLA